MLNKIKETGKKLGTKAKELAEDHGSEILMGMLYVAYLVIIGEGLKSIHLANKNQKLDYELKMALLNNK